MVSFGLVTEKENEFSEMLIPLSRLEWFVLVVASVNKNRKILRTELGLHVFPICVLYDFRAAFVFVVVYCRCNFIVVKLITL